MPEFTHEKPTAKGAYLAMRVHPTRNLAVVQLGHVYPDKRGDMLFECLYFKRPVSVMRSNVWVWCGPLEFDGYKVRIPLDVRLLGIALDAGVKEEVEYAGQVP